MEGQGHGAGTLRAASILLLFGVVSPAFVLGFSYSSPEISTERIQLGFAIASGIAILSFLLLLALVVFLIRGSGLAPRRVWLLIGACFVMNVFGMVLSVFYLTSRLASDLKPSAEKS